MSDAEILEVLRHIRQGRTNTPIPYCGARLREAKRRGLLVDAYKLNGELRACPTITPAGWDMLERQGSGR